MGWLKFFSFLFLGIHFAYTKAQKEQPVQCAPKAAEPCLEGRRLKYSNALKAYGGSADATLQFEELGPQICLTQIRHDDDGNCFETNTELCAKGEANNLKQTWNSLDNNITALCEKVCPNFLHIASCKNLTVSEELKDSRFEKFCSSFNESIRCVTTALSDCEFGMAIYYAALDHQILPYWNKICNSGCPNTDETVGVIKTCAKPLQELNSNSMKDICGVHYNFKQCVFGSQVVCQEQVMTLISFLYRKYYRIDTLCKTTTSTTTMPTTTVTTVAAAAAAETETTSVTEIETTSNEWTSYRLHTIDLDPSSVYTSCISEESIEKMASDDQLTASTALNLMELEECIYRNLTAGDQEATIAVSLYHIPPALWELYRSYKNTGYQVIMDAIREKCHKNVPNGCTGHRYGLIECESSGATQCYSTTFLKIVLLFILYSIAS